MLLLLLADASLAASAVAAAIAALARFRKCQSTPGTTSACVSAHARRLNFSTRACRAALPSLAAEANWSEVVVVD